MLKRTMAWLLSVILLLSALPMVALAETEPTEALQETTAETVAEAQPAAPAEQNTQAVTATEIPAWHKTTPPQQLRTKAAKIQLLKDAIVWDFQNAKKQEGTESLFGYCGLMAGYQLYYRGINNWRKSMDGKNYFDEYSKMSITGGGYVPVAYPAVEPNQNPEEPQAKTKSLEQLLNQITNYGTHDVYNLLVCFDWTTTEAGALYGHVVFVYGIVDGMVYFTEGADGFGSKAGEPMVCTIAQFAASYDLWTQFEGIVVLGCKDYLDNCASFQSDLFAVCVEAEEIMSLPCEEEDSLPVRAVQKGERLKVIGLVQNREDHYYYQIDDGGEIGYMPVQTLRPILYLHDTLSLDEVSLPQILMPGKDVFIEGTVSAPKALLSKVCVQILDAEGKVLQKVVRDAAGEEYDLGNYYLNQGLEFNKLEEGTYTLRVQADSLIYSFVGTTLAKQVQTQTLLEQEFIVTADTEKAEETLAQTRIAEPAVEVEATVQLPGDEKNGWYYENETWYCYKQGEPCSGWVRSAGIAYYLNEDGSVTTGWTEVEGKLRLFTATGALVIGWTEDQGVKRYMDENGIAVVGWYLIDETYYYFNEQGVMQDQYLGSALRQLRQMGLTMQDVHQANAAKNTPQEE